MTPLHSTHARHQTDRGRRVSFASREEKKCMENTTAHIKLSGTPGSGPSYLPNGWEFAIVPVKPPKGYNDRGQRMRLGNRGQQLGVRFPRSVWLCELRQRNHALWPAFPSPSGDGSGAQQRPPECRPDSQVTTSVPPQNAGSRSSCQKTRKIVLLERHAFPNHRKAKHDSKHNGPRKERQALPKLLPGLHV